MMMLKLRKLMAKESLSRTRKRIKNDLKQSANTMIYNYIFNQGAEGYLRDRNCYGK